MSASQAPKTEGKQLGSGAHGSWRFMAPAAVPTLAGVALTGSALISRRGKPFA